MRRAAPPPVLRVDTEAAGPWARVRAGGRGLGLAPAEPPEGAALAPGPALRAVRGAPVPTHEAALAAGGALALVASPGVARSVRVPEAIVVHDRRPPGLMRVAAAARANAGLLADDGGWRAVVLPSLGDLAAELGPGPVAMRDDGRRVAALRDGAIEEADLPGGDVVARQEAPPALGALAYDCDGRLLRAAGGGVGAEPAAAEGSPVVALAAASAAPRALARHADGSCSLWDTASGERIGAWPGPLQGPASIALSADGERAALSTPFASPAAACVARARDGALVHHVAEARAIALAPGGGGLLLGGEWGLLWVEPADEESA